MFVSTKKVGLVCLYITTAILILLKIATWLNAEEIFGLNDVIITGTNVIAEKEILDLVEVGMGTNLFNYDLRFIAQKIEQHPYVKDASVSRRLPDNLVVRITEKEPLAVVNADYLNILDESGEPLPFTNVFQHIDYPVITNLDAAGKDKDKALRVIIDYLRLCKENNFTLYSQISEISYSHKIGLLFLLTENSIPVVVGNTFSDEKNNHLFQVITILKNNGQLQEVKALDLRFRSQVVVKTKLSI